MHDYELTLILKPDITDEGTASLADRVGTLLAPGGGQVVNVTVAGRKRLAFPINHSRDGSYVVFQLRTRPDALPEVERSLKLSEDVLRHMFIRR